MVLMDPSTKRPEMLASLLMIPRIPSVLLTLWQMTLLLQMLTFCQMALQVALSLHEFPQLLLPQLWVRATMSTSRMMAATLLTMT